VRDGARGCQRVAAMAEELCSVGRRAWSRRRKAGKAGRVGGKMGRRAGSKKRVEFFFFFFWVWGGGGGGAWQHLTTLFTFTN